MSSNLLPRAFPFAISPSLSRALSSPFRRTQHRRSALASKPRCIAIVSRERRNAKVANTIDLPSPCPVCALSYVMQRGVAVRERKRRNRFSSLRRYVASPRSHHSFLSNHNALELNEPCQQRSPSAFALHHQKVSRELCRLSLIAGYRQGLSYFCTQNCALRESCRLSPCSTSHQVRHTRVLVFFC